MCTCCSVPKESFSSKVKIFLILITASLIPVSTLAAPFTNSGDISPHVWDPLDDQYENGHPMGYTEGETAAIVVEETSNVGTAQQFDYCIQIIQTHMGDDLYAFTEFDPWDQTYPGLPLPDGTTPTFDSTIGDVNAENATLVSVSSPVLGGGECDPDYFQMRVVYTKTDTTKDAFFAIGARLATEGAALPAGSPDATVPNDHGASFILGTFQVRVAGAGDKTINFSGNEIATVPQLNLSKTVTTASGTCGVDDVEMLTVELGDTVKFCFKITNIGDEDLIDLTLTDAVLGVDLTSSLVGLTDEDGDNSDDDLDIGAMATAEYLHVTTGPILNTATASASSISTEDPASTLVYFCGDETVDMGEQCDDGNTNNNDGCSATCQTEFCGDEITQTSEECDDGNTTSNDGCDANCNLEFCGDGVEQTSEQCDDGNNSDNDGCNSDCIVEFCGDGTQQTGEQCDDGNTSNNDGCNSQCLNEVCGDGTQQTGEQCDDGNTNNNDGCSSNCLNEVCGDGIQQTSEQCDDGNNSDNDGCNSDCIIESCGDGTQQTSEQCDDGNTENNDGCNSTCNTEFCGDEITQSNEQCDDGNTTNNDGCSSQCLNEVCGDGTQQTGEQCDDGNTANNDGCNSNCIVEFCGDETQQSGEQCDDGNTDSNDGCSSTCNTEFCGDEITQSNEQCDDGNNIGNDGCNSDCQNEFCGDGVTQTGEQCDDGNDISGDGCSSECIDEPDLSCSIGFTSQCSGEQNVFSLTSTVSASKGAVSYDWSVNCSNTAGLVENGASATLTVPDSAASTQITCTVTLNVSDQGQNSSSCEKQVLADSCDFGCATSDQFETQLKLDGLGPEQHAINKQLVGTLRKLLGNKSAESEALNESSDRAAQNWEFVWSLPNVATVCTNLVLCISIDNTPTISAFEANAARLSEIARSLSKKVKANKNASKAVKTRATRLNKKAIKLFEQAVALLGNLAPVQSDCIG